MIFGFGVPLSAIAIGGVIMLSLLLFQMASGMRWIKLPPKHRIKIHKVTGLTLVGLAVGHGAMGLIIVTGVAIG